jgi:hypothetical protein
MKRKGNEMNQLTNIASISVDTLGSLLAQIKDLTVQADMIKDSFKDQATVSDTKVFEGALFKATVIEANRDVVDYKKLLSDLGIGADVVAKYTKVTAVFSVKTTSR